MPELEDLEKTRPVTLPDEGSIITYFQETEDGLLQLLARKPDGETQVVLTSIGKEDSVDVPEYRRHVQVSQKRFSVKFYVNRRNSAVGESESLDLKPYVSCGASSGTSDTGFRYDFYFYDGPNTMSRILFHDGEYGIFKLKGASYGYGRVKVIVSFPDADPGEIDITLHRDYSKYDLPKQEA